MTKYKENLILELIQRAKDFGLGKYGSVYIQPLENTKSSIIFNSLEYSFHHQSWKTIQENEDYKNRTEKIHPNTIAKGIYEMQSSNSSDALAMNIFCHPKFMEWKEIYQLFQLPPKFSIEFGFNPKIQKTVNNKIEYDSTEVDVFINNSIIGECKLTESDFTSKSKNVVEQYKEFKNVFYFDKLLQDENQYFNYQLIRNILAANQHDCRFILFCDMRRPDLAKSFYQTIRCIKDDYLNLRTRCEIIYWQDIAHVVGADLKKFLNEKYGI